METVMERERGREKPKASNCGCYHLGLTLFVPKVQIWLSSQLSCDTGCVMLGVSHIRQHFNRDYTFWGDIPVSNPAGNDVGSRGLPPEVEVQTRYLSVGDAMAPGLLRRSGS